MPRISELPAAGSAADADELAANQAGTTRKLTRAQLLSGTAPATRQILSGVGIGGGGTLEFDRTLNFDIEEMTVAAAVDAAADYIAIHDASAGGVRKTLISTLPTGGGGGGAVAIEDEGQEIIAAASRINFSGATVAVSSPAAGEALVTVSSSTSSSGGLSGWTDVKLNHGAVGNGSTTDTTAIQNALNSSATTIFFPVGTYRVTAQLTVPPGKRLIGSGIGRSIIDGRPADIADGSAIFKCSGSLTTLPGMSAMVEGNPRITFNSSIDGSLKLGDWIRVTDVTNNSMTHYAGEKDGFYCMVCSAEVTQMYPYGGVRRTLPAPRSGGPTSNLQAFKLDQRGLWIGDLEVWASGFDLDSTDNTADNGIVVMAESLANIFIWNSKLVGGANDGLQLRQCCNIHLNNSVFGNHAGTWNGGNAYGIHVRGSGHVYASNCTFLSQRHAFEADNHAMASHDVVVSGGMIACPQEQDFQQPATPFYTALDTHTGCYNLTFRDVYVYGGCDLRSSGTKLLGCTIHGCKDSSNDGSILIHDLTDYDIEVRGNTLVTYLDRFQGGAAITLFASPIDAGKNSHFIIADNVIKQIGSHSAPLIYLRGDSTGGADTGVFIITGNVVLNAPSGQLFMDINVASGKQLVVRNNVFPSEMTIGSQTGFSGAVVSMNVDGGSAI